VCVLVHLRGISLFALRTTLHSIAEVMSFASPKEAAWTAWAAMSHSASHQGDPFGNPPFRLSIASPGEIVADRFCLRVALLGSGDVMFSSPAVPSGSVL
jgi:hypothetical protein